MSLCLLRRWLQNFGISNVGPCRRLSNAMIALLVDWISSPSTCSTSQPGQPKWLWRGLLAQLCPAAEHSMPHSATWHRARRDRLPHRLSSSGSSQHCSHLTNALPDDRQCLTCGSHSFVSCPVCEQDFCSNHLYACSDCDNRYCGHCLDDHRADGHWTDSDSAAELNHGWRDKFVCTGSSVGMHGSVSTPNCTQRFCGEQGACHLRKGAISAPELNRPSRRFARRTALTSFTLLFARATHAIRGFRSSAATGNLVKLFSQSGRPLEVSL